MVNNKKFGHFRCEDVLFVIGAIFIVFFDQLTKILVRTGMDLNASIPILKNIFHITYIQNTGATWGMMKGYNPLFIFVSFVAVFIFLFFYKDLPRPKLAAGIVFGGILGNLIDRLYLGYVVDFLDLQIWPIFNIADSGISAGIVILLFFMLIEEKKGHRQQKSAKKVRNKKKKNT